MKYSCLQWILHFLQHVSYLVWWNCILTNVSQWASEYKMPCCVLVLQGRLQRSGQTIAPGKKNLANYKTKDLLNWKKKQDHLRMNIAPDQTIILGLQIFLDHRLSTYVFLSFLLSVFKSFFLVIFQTFCLCIFEPFYLGLCSSFFSLVHLCST